MPYFDADEMLEGCRKLTRPDTATGIFLNAISLIYANGPMAFAHEAGHFLGLEHVFDPGDDFCDDTPWYDYDAHWTATGGDIVLHRTGCNGEIFWSDNIMDYDYGFMTGLTPDQVRRIRYTLQYAYFIPGEAGKEVPATRSSGRTHHFRNNPIR